MESNTKKGTREMKQFWTGFWDGLALKPLWRFARAILRKAQEK